MRELKLHLSESEVLFLREMIKHDIGASLSILYDANDSECIKNLANRLAFTIRIFEEICE